MCEPVMLCIHIIACVTLLLGATHTPHAQKHTHTYTQKHVHTHTDARTHTPTHSRHTVVV